MSWRKAYWMSRDWIVARGYDGWPAILSRRVGTPCPRGTLHIVSQSMIRANTDAVALMTILLGPVRSGGPTNDPRGQGS